MGKPSPWAGRICFLKPQPSDAKNPIQFLQIVNAQPSKLKRPLYLLPRDQTIASVNLVMPEPQKTPTTPFVNGLDHPFTLHLYDV
jgi:hypothetical protein